MVGYLGTLKRPVVSNYSIQKGQQVDPVLVSSIVHGKDESRAQLKTDNPKIIRKEENRDGLCGLIEWRGHFTLGVP